MKVEGEKEIDCIEVKRLSKGYGWTIRLYGEDKDELLKKIRKIDKKLRDDYQEEEEY